MAVHVRPGRSPLRAHRSRRQRGGLHYQPSGELTQLVDRNGHATNMGYDHLGRVTSIVDAIGRAHARAYATPLAGAWSGQDVLSGSLNGTPASTSLTADTPHRRLPARHERLRHVTAGGDGIPAGPATRGQWPGIELYQDATFQLSYGKTYDTYGRLTEMQDRPASQFTSSTVLRRAAARPLGKLLLHHAAADSSSRRLGRDHTGRLLVHE
jgi:YD repeat-containing protein